MSTYRLPSGRYTQNVGCYIQQWRALANKVTRFFPGYALQAYDPGLWMAKGELLTDGTTRHVDSVRLSTDAAILLIQSARPKKALKATQNLRRDT
jgi:hypothetical protein